MVHNELIMLKSNEILAFDIDGHDDDDDER